MHSKIKLSAAADDSRFSGRAGLIYNFDNGIAPYVSYSTSYNPIIGLNAQNQLFLPETRQAGRNRCEDRAEGL
ncbi:TonB-dependent receptor domain-containing protein [Bradyrhizobium diazoefficiens]